MQRSQPDPCVRLSFPCRAVPRNAPRKEQNSAQARMPTKMVGPGERREVAKNPPPHAQTSNSPPPCRERRIRTPTGTPAAPLLRLKHGQRRAKVVAVVLVQ